MMSHRTKTIMMKRATKRAVCSGRVLKTSRNEELIAAVTIFNGLKKNFAVVVVNACNDNDFLLKNSFDQNLS